MRTIRSLTEAQRDTAQERSQERYDRIYSAVEDEFRDEWRQQFPGFPFEPDGCAVHRETQRRVELEQRHDAEESIG